ncbi:MAG: hypothetical protein M3081_19835, partial [Gemmatimonadota bacterium]|nr:hypothetical protein [Gemmatimonadota bacterium]
IKQGGKESGVAVIAAGHSGQGPEGGEPPDAPDDSWLTTDPPLEADDEGDIHPSPDDDAAPPDQSPSESPRHTSSATRLTVYRASYRLTLKGVDRGKWEVEVVAEADAPRATIDDVVRGVTRRAGEASEAERMTGEEFRSAIGAQ